MTDFKAINILYEDDSILVVDKPEGLPVHKNDFMPRDAAYLTKMAGKLKDRSVFNVHRLDAKTSGVIILALSQEAAKLMAQQFQQKAVRKKYTAIVKGNPGEGVFDEKVLVKKKSNFKKPAVTHFKTIKTVQTQLFSKGDPVSISLVEVTPETGRWHQIRQHFARNRYDIIGDTHHGDFDLNREITRQTGIKRLMLHASGIGFNHPFENKTLNIESPLPESFNNLMSTLEAETS